MERPMSRIIFRQVFAGLAALVVVTASVGAIAVQIDGEENATEGVCLDDGKYGQMAFQTQENRKIRPSVGCGENPVPSTVVRGMISANLEVIWEMSG